jgi:curli biogenesis system outer membrane secretion channel CsgG
VKKYSSLFIIFFLLSGCGVVTRYTPLSIDDTPITVSPNFKFNKNIKVAFMPFYGKQRDNFGATHVVVEEQASDMFAMNLMGAGFSIVERTQLQRVFSELQLSSSGLLSKSDINKIGKLMEVDMIVMGNMDGWGSTWTDSYTSASIRFIDTTTGEVLVSIACSHIKGRKYIPAMANALIEKIK